MGLSLFFSLERWKLVVQICCTTAVILVFHSGNDTPPVPAVPAVPAAEMVHVNDAG